MGEGQSNQGTVITIVCRESIDFAIVKGLSPSLFAASQGSRLWVCLYECLPDRLFETIYC